MDYKQTLHELAMLYSQNNDNCKKCTPEELYALYKDTYNKISEAHSNDNTDTWLY